MIRIVDTEWVDQNLDDSSLSIMDSRPLIKYLQGHIPGAVNLPTSKLFDAGTLELLSLDKLKIVCGEAGIDETRTALIYDAYDGQNGAMLAWTLEFLGHPKILLLSSLVERWAKEARPVLYRPLKPEPRTLRAMPNLEVRATFEEVSSSRNLKLVDLRSREEFDGNPPGELRQGHLPGAVNLPWTSLLGEESRLLRPREELEKIASQLGISPDDRIATYCSFGPRAAIGYVALQQLNFKHVKVYDGSFQQWAKHRATRRLDDCLAVTGNLR